MKHQALRQMLQALRDELLALDGDAGRRRDAPWLPLWERLPRRIDGLMGHLEREDEPLLVVVAGGTGAGKSTLANTLAGSAVLDPLETLEALGAGQLPSALIDEMTALRERARQRLAHSRDHVVVAVAGGTGKSSLVNALVGQTPYTKGVRRPATERAQAVPIGDATGAEPLLDWLRVEERHPLPADGMLAPLRGAVLLDLPDVDSTVREHARVAERLIERCDLLLWVMDPLKYGQALAHEHYFARLAHHAEVLLVVLNHIDRLATAEVARPCRCPPILASD
ncbi:tRNA modification GTPase TrmE [Thiorhodovibrio winogradskyi]|uniref:tRNA modification GTPase TrmE n=2 Tax=Thiorhodovibrio winogradskyi TaxID=77007 RepID=A0ABZ0SFL0_9GAMM